MKSCVKKNPLEVQQIINIKHKIKISLKPKDNKKNLQNTLENKKLSNANSPKILFLSKSKASNSCVYYDCVLFSVRALIHNIEICI